MALMRQNDDLKKGRIHKGKTVQIHPKGALWAEPELAKF